MAVSSTTNKVIYNGNGTTTFPYTFKIFADTDLIVTKVTIADETEADLTLTTDYTVTDAGEEAGGDVELVEALTSAYKLVIRRVVPFLQATDYVENDNFPAESHEEALDRCAMRDQQLQEQIDRCLKVGVAETDVLTPAEIVAAVASAEAAKDAAELAQTGAETAETNAETAETNAELAETNAEAAQVAAEAAQAAAEAVATALAGDIVSTFTNADLTDGVLTITHNLDLDAPYPINALIFDNNSKQVLPDSVTGLANSVEIDLSSYGTITGTWGYSYGLTAGAATLTPTSTDGTFAANSDALVPTQKAAKTYVDGKATDAGIATTDVTTNNASTSKHGFLKKLSNVATEFMNGVGNWVAITIDSLLPSQTGNSGKFLTTNGSAASWGTPSTLTYVSDTTSGSLVAVADTERSTTEISYTKLKEFVINGSGSVFVSFDLKANGATGYARIYKNGVAVGTERSKTADTYTTYTETISGLVSGDLVQLYAKRSGVVQATVRNFRLYASLMAVNTD